MRVEDNIKICCKNCFDNVKSV